MSFEPRELSLLACANGFALWHYRTDDGTLDAGYFDPATHLLRAGDLILAVCGLAPVAGPAPSAGVYLVTEVGRDRVRLAALAGPAPAS